MEKRNLNGSESLIKDMTLPTAPDFWEHVGYIKETGYFHETEDTIFVHAGIQPGTLVGQTDPMILMWIRDEFYKAYSGEKTVVFGHTPAFLLRGTSNNDVYFGDNRIIGIDGGAVYGGQLNCLELPSGKVYHVRKQ